MTDSPMTDVTLADEPLPADLPDEVKDGDASQGEPETPDAEEGVPI